MMDPSVAWWLVRIAWWVFGAITGMVIASALWIAVLERTQLRR